MRACRWTLILVALGCGSDPGKSGESGGGDTSGATAVPIVAVDQVGSWTPGTATSSVVSRHGPTLPLQVWFPSADVGGSTHSYAGLLPGTAFDDVSITCESPLPVVLFSHGYGGVNWQSPFVLEFLSTHGYLSIAPDHVNNTTFDLDESLVAESVLRRPDDLVDAFEGMADDPVFGPCIDRDAGFAVMGHSFGGYTTLATAGAELDDLDALCATKGGTPCAVAELWNNGWGDGSTPVQLGDDRVWAAVALSPWHADVLSSAGTAAVGVPTFVFSGDRDLTTPWEDVAELYSGLTTEPKHLGELIDGGHYSFSPIGCSLVEGDGCGGDYLATDRVEALTNHAVTAFLEGVRGVNTVFPIEAVEIQWP